MVSTAAALLLGVLVTLDATPAQAQAPTLSSATVNGASLVLTYDAALNTSSTPATTDYTVKVVGTARSLASGGVSITGSAVTLTLSSAVTPGEAVTVTYVPGSNPVQNQAGTDDAGALTDRAVTNTTTDTTAPTLSSATVNGDSLVLTYNEALDTSSTPATTDYTVKVVGTARSLASGGVSITGSAVTLTLSSAVTPGEAVTVTYVAGSNPVQDEAGNDAGALTDRAVTNTTTDTTAPTLSSATVNGDSLVLTYNEALDTSSTPATTDYTVKVVGTARSLASGGVSITGSAVTLTLSSAVTPGEAVTVTYVAGSNPVQDEAGNDAGALTDRAVTNTTTDTTAPTLSSATVNGDSLVLTYNEALDTSSTPATTDYTVKVVGTARSLASGGVSITGSAVTLTLSSAVTPGEAVTVTYVAGSNPVQDEAGNDAGALTDRAVTNTTTDTTAPTLSSATVNGDSLVLTYNEALDTSSTPATTDYTVKVVGTARSLASGGVSITGSAVTLTLSSAVTPGEAVTVTYVAGSNPVQDEAGNDAGALTDRAVTNTTTDTTAPTLSSATVNGDSLVLTYNEALDTSSTPATTDYTVKVVGTARSLASGGVSITGSAVTLTLSSAVTPGEAVTVTYVAGSNPVQDEAGNDAGALTDRAVTNTTPDTTAPTLSSATVNGDSLVLTYNEALDTSSTPATTDYTVKVVGTARSLASGGVSITGSAVTLTLSSAVTPGEAVTVTYVAGSNPVQDEADNAAVALSDRAVTNNTAPTLSSATVNGDSLVLTYDAALDTGSTPAASAYTVEVAGTARSVSTVTVSGSTVTLALSSAVTAGETVKVSYAVPGTNPVQDATDGNAAGALSDRAVTNNTAPTLSSATVNGDSLVLTYDAALDTGSTPAASAYTVEVAGTARSVSTVTVSGSTVTLALSSAVTAGETVKVSYAVPGTNPVQDATDGNAAGALSDRAVTNNTAPTLSSATVNGDSLVLTYDAALDTGSTPAASAYTVEVAGTARSVSTVTVSGSTVTLALSSAVTAGETVKVSYAVPGTNPVQDATDGNAAGALSDRTVTNTTAPTLSSATVKGVSLVLTYDAALDTGSTPAASAYTVEVAGTARSVSTVTVSGSTVTLALSSAVTAGETVKVSYAVPGTNPVQDATDGNAAGALSDRTVTNTTAPTLTRATVNSASLVLTYDEALDTSSTPAASAYAVTVEGTQRTVSSVAITGSAVTLTLSSAVTAGETVTVTYTAGSNPVQDAEGNAAAALTDRAVTNTTADTSAPSLSSAHWVNGASLVLTYGQALDTGSTPATTDYAVTVAGTPRSVSSVSITGSAVTLTLSSAVTPGETVTVTYTPGSNPVQDEAGNAAAAFSDQTVTNTTADTTAPTLSSVTVNGASLVLTYDEALDTSSTPATTDYAVTVAGTPRSVSSVSITGSAVTLTLSSAVTPGEAVTVTYTAGSNPVQDAEGNAAAALADQTVDATVPVPALPGVAVLLLAALLVLVTNRLGQSGKVSL